jgi:MarR family 2-MHQ and catechol resistance regulon transcriptional repressor
MVKDLDRETARISAEHGLTYPQFQVLEALLHKGSLTIGQIRDAILSSNGTVPVVVDNLQKKGLVRRTKDPKDRRRSVVSLTDEGRELIELVWPENVRMVTEKFDVWTTEEKDELIRIVGKYHAALKRARKNEEENERC